MTAETSVREAIAAANDRFGEAFRRGSAADLAAAYTPDGRLLPPNFPPVDGTDAIRAFWGAVLEMGIRDARLESIEVEAFGDTAVEVGRYHLYVEGGAEANNGKYVVIWKKLAGGWRLHRDIWNSCKPAAGS